MILERIKEMPDVPDINVVRCKDCRYYGDEDEYEHWCNGWGWPARLITPDDFAVGE